MDIGIGLPNAVPGTEPPALLDWARRAEDAGFSSLATIGRLVYGGYEELVALGAVAAVTSRIRLTTGVLLGPLYTNAALLAKQTATLDRLSGGRLVLGVGLGGRDDDFTASGLTTRGRGRRLTEQLTEVKRVWAGEERGLAGPVGPRPARPGGPQLVLGGTSEASFRRVAELADGWIMGGGTPDRFAAHAARVEAAWRKAGREGRPRKLALSYFALGPDARAHADAFLLDYYGFLGDLAPRVAAGAAVTPQDVTARVAAFEKAGCDELILVPTTSDPGQVGLLAETLD
ncbi:LLM class flavin-dependent oxidoreductase [Streptomyces sp. XM83C]|jgi:alkanesulfonate monooxygenase SsuD/methylene tetrahydromethanopterin reductase-like flavin-dependent oxidoreductase (luciferase family)|uniref:LLM class flavin-dependent oxidoreductase n=1 Tax=unclassified Streptomyces TaxID=2593676 RepID=UPI001FFBDEEF|nr:LLM class flavin-dependent oxidoreductase [Streptomyces sp. XM83C]MCK1820596.1 LLM class flavin-dependent oxidoreductase [Streptomyces sp. XM83C]